MKQIAAVDDDLEMGRLIKEKVKGRKESSRLLSSGVTPRLGHDKKKIRVRLPEEILQ